MNCKVNKKVKIIIIICISVIVLFGLYNFIWHKWKVNKYEKYTEDMEEFVENMSYIYTSDDSYDYNVKFPEYLTYTGNLCVAVPGGQCALIIWPKVTTGYTYGVQIEKDGMVYSIMLSNDFTAEDGRFDELINEHTDTIDELRKRADDMWKLGITDI